MCVCVLQRNTNSRGMGIGSPLFCIAEQQDGLCHEKRVRWRAKRHGCAVFEMGHVPTALAVLTVRSESSRNLRHSGWRGEIREHFRFHPFRPFSKERIIIFVQCNR